jgi:hypothetical protein
MDQTVLTDYFPFLPREKQNSLKNKKQEDSGIFNQHLQSSLS